MLKMHKYFDKIKSRINDFFFKFKKENYIEDDEKIRLELIEEYNRENKNLQELLEKEFIDYKNLGLILIDIVPYKNRESLIDGLKRLFVYDELTPYDREQHRIDIEKNIPKIDIEATRQGSSRVHLGRLQNSDIMGGFLEVIKRNLPPMFDNLDVYITQFGDTYILTYVVELKAEYKTKGIKESFIHHKDLKFFEKELDDGHVMRGGERGGIECDPNMDGYFNELSQFLKEFSVGLYLNKNPTQVCPNVKITYMEKIPFHKFEEWAKQNIEILMFMGFEPVYYSRIKNYLWGIQDKRTKGNESITAGLVILASNDEEITRNYESQDRGFFDDLTRLINRNFELILLQLYWANYNLEDSIKNWNNYITETMKELNGIAYVQNKKEMESLFKLNNLIVNNYRDFEGYRLYEERKYDFFTKNLFFNERFNKTMIALKAFDLRNNIYKEIYTFGKWLLDQEKAKNESLREEFCRLLEYVSNITNLTNSQINLEIQSSMKIYTLLVLIFTFLMLIFTIVMVYSNPASFEYIADKMRILSNITIKN
jgi:hypothetical protein